MTEHVIVTDADGIRTIRMNRPDKKNALTLAMYEAMTAALEGANADESVRCVLIAGVPGALSAGVTKGAVAVKSSFSRNCAGGGASKLIDELTQIKR
jgi:enoyl-CoA hydratase/carnithine racemase